MSRRYGLTNFLGLPPLKMPSEVRILSILIFLSGCLNATLAFGLWMASSNCASKPRMTYLPSTYSLPSDIPESTPALPSAVGTLPRSLSESIRPNQ